MISYMTRVPGLQGEGMVLPPSPTWLATRPRSLQVGAVSHQVGEISLPTLSQLGGEGKQWHRAAERRGLRKEVLHGSWRGFCHVVSRTSISTPIFGLLFCLACPGHSKTSNRYMPCFPPLQTAVQQCPFLQINLEPVNPL